MYRLPSSRCVMPCCRFLRSWMTIMRGGDEASGSDRVMLKDNLLKLQRHLQDGDLDAVAIFSQLRGIIEAGEFDEFSHLEEAMAQLDFPEALAHCLNLLAQLAAK